MTLLTRQRSLIAGLACSGSLLLLAALPPTRGQSIGKAETPLQVAQLLDCVIQPRFQEDAGVFGLSRIITLIGHERVASLQPRTDQEESLLHRANAANREYMLGFLHTTHVPGQMRRQGVSPSVAPRPVPMAVPAEVAYFTLITHVVKERLPRGGFPGSFTPTARMRQFSRDCAQIEKVAKSEWIRRKGNGEAVADCDGWKVVLRPVRALKDSCVNCHQGSKRGDTLGVMVYAVGKTVQKPGTKFL